jgi:hypothetical protein
VAALWHYRRDDTELGPVAFSELVRLVRAEQLGVDDPVREDWNPEWRPAALAVGLFHMAGRQDLFDRWEAEQAEFRRREAEARAAAEPLAAWQQRLAEVEAERAAHEAEAAAVLDAERMANAISTEIDATLAAALDEVESRERERAPTRWMRLRQSVAQPEMAHRLFRWLPTVVAPNLVALGILRWSEREAQRFPDPEQLASGLRAFPAWGTCDPPMYFFLLFDAMVVAGVATYFLARTVEQFADD